LAEAPREGVIEAGDGELYAGSREFNGLREEAIIRVIIL
jgi:hypothetical protein